MKRSKGLLLACGLILTIIFFSSLAWAGDGALDPSFNPGLGVSKIPIIRNLTSYNITPSTSNLWLISGYFTSVSVTGHSDTNITSIARLTYGAVVDTTFNPPVINGEVRGVRIMNPNSASSQILIWGQFTVTSGSATYNNLARLNSDGSVDISFNNGTSGTSTFTSDGGVMAVFVDPSGNLLVGGCSMKLTNDASSTAYQLLRLTPNGVFDGSYTGARSAPGGYVVGIWTVPSYMEYTSPIVISGTLPRPGTTHNDYILMRSSADYVTQVANIGDEVVTDGPIYNMVPWTINSTTYWLIVGQFKTVLGSNMSCVARLNYDLSTPSLDPGFNKLGDGANHFVNKIDITGNTANQVILAGNFTAFGTTPCGYLVRLNTDGSVDQSFTTNNGTGADDRIFGLGGGQTPFICGSFRSFNGTIPSPNLRGGLAMIDANGNLTAGYSNLTANSSTPGTVYSADSSGNNGQMIIGGDFTGYNGKYHNGVARINWDGSLDPSFTGGIDGGVVRSVRTQDNGKILLAGSFYSLHAYSRTSLGQLNSDDTVDQSFNPVVTRSNGTLADLRMTDVDSHGKIMIGGDFSTINGTAKTAFARLQPDGSLDNFTFTPPAALSNIRVNAGGSMSGDSYVMVGKATYSGDGLTRGFGCRLTSTGAIDTSFAINQSPVPNVALFDDEVKAGGSPKGSEWFYLCGKFANVIGPSSTTPRGHIAKYNADGTLDATWAPTGSNAPMHCVDLQANGKILIGGPFTQYNGTTRNGVARLNADGSLDLSFDPGTGALGGPVYMLNWDSYDGTAFVGGSFTTYNGASGPGLVRIIAGPRSRPTTAPLLLLLD